MKKNNNSMSVLMAIIVVIFILEVSYMVGYYKRGKDEDKWACQYKYGYVAQSEISGNCLKYFKR